MKKYKATVVAATACVSALLVAGPAQPAQADGAADNCNAADTVAPGSFGTGTLTWCILAAKESAETKKTARENFVKGLLEMLTNHTGGNYNIMIFDIKGKNAFGDPWFVNHYTESLQDVAFQGDVEYHDETSREDQTYRIWIFSGGGSFTNHGDGGWINWGFYGLWDRNGSTIEFQPTIPPAVPGVPKGETPGPGDTLPTPGVPARPVLRSFSGPEAPVTEAERPPVGVPVQLRTVNSLGAVATNTSSGSSVVAGKLGTTNGTWTFKDAGDGRYEIANGHGPVLTANMSTYYAQINTWKGSSTQKWEVIPVGGGAHQIRISDQDCLTYHEDYKKLGVWTCDGSEGQRWTITR
ncbi:MULTISPECIES: RICIN domain-containing protein [unclassified Streptomyces]|uniref:RICIN domain-containing protein n=1 Tax=unclassified Streptomyces TaxID=2593676 RepID=UPI003678B43B